MNLKKIYDSQESYFRWRLERVRRIEKRFPEIFEVKDKKVLDIGCGAQAPLSYYLSEFKKGNIIIYPETAVSRTVKIIPMSLVKNTGIKIFEKTREKAKTFVT